MNKTLDKIITFLEYNTHPSVVIKTVIAFIVIVLMFAYKKIKGSLV